MKCWERVYFKLKHDHFLCDGEGKTYVSLSTSQTTQLLLVNKAAYAQSNKYCKVCVLYHYTFYLSFCGIKGFEQQHEVMAQIWGPFLLYIYCINLFALKKSSNKHISWHITNILFHETAHAFLRTTRSQYSFDVTIYMFNALGIRECYSGDCVEFQSIQWQTNRSSTILWGELLLWGNSLPQRFLAYVRLWFSSHSLQLNSFSSTCKFAAVFSQMHLQITANLKSKNYYQVFTWYADGIQWIADLKHQCFIPKRTPKTGQIF